MAWKITKNMLPGTVSGVRSSLFEKYGDKATHRFRLYDDDSTLYFEGVSTSNSSFAPLDDYGMPGYGCTEIRYWEKVGNKWGWYPL